jgi:hypothetical protein
LELNPFNVTPSPAFVYFLLFYAYDFLSFFTVSCDAMSHKMKTPLAGQGQGF